MVKIGKTDKINCLQRCRVIATLIAGGMQNGIDILEDSLTFSHKVKNSLNYVIQQSSF